ncbi:hypothetical protein ABT120_34450 [Nonomuraea angiospora]
MKSAWSTTGRAMRQPDPRHQDGNQVVFLAGDDESANPPSHGC